MLCSCFIYNALYILLTLVTSKILTGDSFVSQSRFDAYAGSKCFAEVPTVIFSQGAQIRICRKLSTMDALCNCIIYTYYIPLKITKGKAI